MLSEGAVPCSNLVCTSRSGIIPWPQEALLKLPALVNAPIIFCFSCPAWHVDISKAAFILPVCQHILLTVTNPFTSSFTAPPLSASTAIFAGSKLVFSLPDHGENSPASLGCEQSFPRTQPSSQFPPEEGTGGLLHFRGVKMSR